MQLRCLGKLHFKLLDRDRGHHKNDTVYLLIMRKIVKMVVFMVFVEAKMFNAH